MPEPAESQIEGVIIRPLVRHEDERGWLAELFRSDELEVEHMPAMGYVSVTRPGVGRGPHEHVEQTDIFCFVGPGSFEVYLWDKREDSPSMGANQSVLVGEDMPTIVVIPPGVVHGYRNVSQVDAMVINLPNRLYRGEGRADPVDEIRHEDDSNSPYSIG